MTSYRPSRATGRRTSSREACQLGGHGLGALGCYDPAVNPDDVRSFAARDWELVERAKRRYWAARKGRMSAVEALAVAEGLRLHARALRPDWPSPAERDADVEAHARVSASLRRAG